MSDFDWPDVSYFQAKFGWERVKASKVILNYSKLSRFDKPFGGGLDPPWFQSMQIQVTVFSCFYKLTFWEKTQTLCYGTEILTCREVLYTEVLHAKSVLMFCKKSAFQNMDFYRLKCQLKRKKNWHSMFLKIFQVSVDEGKGK